jgi:hypothetical protein
MESKRETWKHLNTVAQGAMEAWSWKGFRQGAVAGFQRKTELPGSRKSLILVQW